MGGSGKVFDGILKRRIETLEISPKIYILLPVHNRLYKTRLFIDSLLAQTYENYHLVLIDDGSSDGTAEYVKNKVKPLTVITGKGDWWWGGGLHQGYLWLKKNQVSGDDLALMMNDDTEFASGFLQTAVDFLVQRPKTLLLARILCSEKGDVRETGVHVDWQKMTFEGVKVGADINCLATRGLFLRVNDFLDIGGFHPTMLPHYLSDYEFTIRAHRKGYKLMTDASLRLIADESTTGYHGLDSVLSRQEFFKKYFSKRSADNPFSWFSFVALACPWPWKGMNFLRVFYGVIKVLFKNIFLRRRQ